MSDINNGIAYAKAGEAGYSAARHPTRASESSGSTAVSGGARKPHFLEKVLSRVRGDSVEGTLYEEQKIVARNGKVHPDGRIELLTEEWQDELAFGWSKSVKWASLTTIFCVQMSMNYNASVYGNAIAPLSEEFGISNRQARMGQLAFLIAYAFGCELWAPWSEEYGRWAVLQLSLAAVNIFQLPCLVAVWKHTNFSTVLAGRIMGGLSSAGGSVTLGIVADMWHADTQQYAVAFVVLSSVGGSVFGPVVGGFIEQYLPLKYNFISQLGLGLLVQAIHFFSPETRADVLLDRQAKKLRRQGHLQIVGPGEVKQHRMTLMEVLKIWIRPFYMFISEPIVGVLSFLSGFSDALIFTFLEAYGPVYSLWNFTPSQIGLSFLAIGIGYIIAYFLFLWRIRRDQRIIANDPTQYPPEKRLVMLMWTAPALPIGIGFFAWFTMGPANGIPWIAPMVASLFIGIANYAIYMATVDYMIASYAEYSASATGGNGFARDFLAGMCVLYTKQLFADIDPKSDKHLRNGSLILFGISVLAILPVYAFYHWGEWFRSKSKFAMSIEQSQKDAALRHAAANGRAQPQQV